MKMNFKNNILLDRPDLRIIADNISQSSKVLDLGCGDGTLLAFLRDYKNIKGTGIELYQDKILQCVKKGVPVLHGDLDDGLGEIKKRTYDYVVLSETIQTVLHPDKLLLEMSRVGKTIIVNFINMGHYSARLHLLLFGKMPVTKHLPYMWYNTPNIHLGTVNDFKDLCRSLNLKIEKTVPLDNLSLYMARFYPNLFASKCIFIIKANSQDSSPNNCINS